MKITFKSQNGCCPEWNHDGIKYYLFEDYDGTWALMSQKIGFLRKDRFYGKGLNKISPVSLLKRFFKNKDNVRYEVKSGGYHFWHWKGKQFATNGEIITVKYESRYERLPFDTYLECLRDAKEYLAEKYKDGQLSLFD